MALVDRGRLQRQASLLIQGPFWTSGTSVLEL
jgi:hypothetical protein